MIVNNFNDKNLIRNPIFTHLLKDNIVIGFIGNIGVGKTTIIENLKKRLLKVLENFEIRINTELITEDIKNFYEEPKKNAFSYQIKILSKSIKKYIEMEELIFSDKNKKRLFLLDRTPLDNWVFARTLLEFTYIKVIDYESYINLYNVFIKKKIIIPQLLIYLTTESIDSLLERILERGNDYEKNITKEYLLMINKFYEQWIFDWNRYQKDSPIIKVNIDIIGWEELIYISY